jgi:hypothetical protein
VTVAPPRASLATDDDELADLESGPGRSPVGAARDEDEDEADESEAAEESSGATAEGARRRRRGRRGGRRRRSGGGSATSFEATFDHGDEGYGLWLDPAVADSRVYSDNWAGHRAVTVVVSAEEIVIKRAGEPGADD